MRAAIALSLLLATGAAVAAPASGIPRLVTDGAGGIRLSVDGKPFIVLGVTVHIW